MCVISLIKILVSIYILINFYINPTKQNIIYVNSLLYYIRYGFYSSIYIIIICNIITYYDMLLLIGRVIKHRCMNFYKKYESHHVHKLITKYNVTGIIMYTYYIGNMMKNIITLIFLKIMLKVCTQEILDICGIATNKIPLMIEQPHNLASCMEDEDVPMSREEEIAKLDTEMKKLNGDLDKLMHFGINAITSELAKLDNNKANTESKHEISLTLMKEFENFFSKNKNE